MRQDYPELARRDTEVIAIGPEGPGEFRAYWEREKLPFVGLADPRHVVANLYGQQVKLLKMGRLPALAIVDAEGRIAYRHYANSISDIPANAELLAVIDELRSATPPRGKLG